MVWAQQNQDTSSIYDCKKPASSTSHVSHASVNAERRLRIEIELNESKICYLICSCSRFAHLETLRRTFLMKMRHAIRDAVKPVIQCFWGVVVDRADYRKLFIASALKLLVRVNRRITVCPGDSCSKVTDTSLMLQSLLIFRLHFQAESWLLFWPLVRRQILIMSLFLRLLLWRFERPFNDFLGGSSSLREWNQLGWDSLSH